MNNIFKFILIILTSAFSSGLNAHGKLPEKFQIPAVFSEKTIDRSDFKHQVTVLEFWASWCTSCGETMVKVSDQLKATGSAANFIGVSVDEGHEMVSGYFGKQSKKVRELEKNIFIDSGLQLAEPLALTSIPTILVVDRDGNIRYRLVGKPSTKQIQNLISNIRSLESH